jgi:ribosomal protein L24
MQKIKIGDTVKIIQGDEKGKTGKVKNVLLEKQKIIVSGINNKIKHIKPSQKDKIIEFLKLLNEAFDIENFKDVLYGIDGTRSYVDIFGNTSRERSDAWSISLLLQ